MNDPIKDGLLAAADAYERDHVTTAATMLDTSTAPARSMELRHQPINADTFASTQAKARLERVEADVIAAWGELHQIPGFSPVEGESLPAAIRRAISEAANQGMTS
ncbi:hypothetical protein ACIPCF_08005 [Paracoccus marcusii]|uniref:hypothetical protein n=1 Tax=Paracoccus marcusii TaxID=59779 RepID=UPI0038B6BBF4